MELVVVTYRAANEASSSGIRVRPLPGQGFDNLNVACSKKMRTSAPIGQHFVLWVVATRRGYGKAYLRANPSQPWQPISAEEANKRVRSMARD